MHLFINNMTDVIRCKFETRQFGNIEFLSEDVLTTFSTRNYSIQNVLIKSEESRFYLGNDTSGYKKNLSSVLGGNMSLAQLTLAVNIWQYRKFMS